MENIGCLGLLLGIAILLGYNVYKGLKAYYKENPVTRLTRPTRPVNLPVPPQPSPKPAPAPARSEGQLTLKPGQTAARREPETPQPHPGLIPGHSADTQTAPAHQHAPLPDAQEHIQKPLNDTDSPVPEDRADLDRRLKDMDRPIVDDGVDIEKLLRDMDKPSQ